jgi:hypothetical protein
MEDRGNAWDLQQNNNNNYYEYSLPTVYSRPCARKAGHLSGRLSDNLFSSHTPIVEIHSLVTVDLRKLTVVTVN